jgi:hypothetical protein
MDPRILTATDDNQGSGTPSSPGPVDTGYRPAATHRPVLEWARVAVAGILTALIVFHLIDLLRKYFVDVLFMDAWEMVPLVEKTYLGTATIGDFWAQANEHRPLFPRLILVPLARLTHWDIRAEVLLNLGLGGLMTLTVARYLRQCRRVMGPAPFWTLPLAALFIFGPGQWENWLWGWEFLIFLQVTTGVIGLYFLTKPDSGWPAFGASLVLGIVGSYSFGNGLMIWLAGPPVILLGSHPRKYLRLAIFILVGLATVGLYVQGWHPNPGHPSVARNFESLAAFTYLMKYFAIYLGASVCNFSEEGAMAAGWAGLALFVAVVVAAIGRPSLRPHLMWPLALGLYVLGNGVLTSAGRAGFGTRQALSSRYETISMPLWIGLVLFLTVVLGVERGKRPVRARAWPTLIYLMIAAIAVCSVTSANRSEAAWQRWHAHLAPAREALRANGDGLLQTRLYPNPFIITERRQTLVRYRLQVFRRGALGRRAR